MASFTISNLVAYSAQVLCIAGAAGVLVAVLRVDAPHARYLLLRITLAVCLVLPWLQTPRAVTATTIGDVTVSLVVASQENALSTSSSAAIDWTGAIVVLLIAGIALRLAWLSIGLKRLARLRHTGTPADAEHHTELQRAMGTTADVRYVAGFTQPVTFGFRAPVVLLPESLRTQSSEIREAVLAHELLHVQRRDWVWVLAEEAARAAFWFHPAMWWLISRIQLAREEVVDALAVARTGRRRAYVEALMAFADSAAAAGLRPTPSGVGVAPAFARKRHLFRRMVLISREDVMTAKRVVLSVTVVLVLLAAGGWYAVGAFPLIESGPGQILQKTPGPLESTAKPITPENPIPRRVQHAEAQYPSEAAAENAFVSVTLRLTLDANGSVAEARVTAGSLRLPDRVTSLTSSRRHPVFEAAVAAAVSAVERWRYDAPAEAPLSLDTTFFFAPGLAVSDTPAAQSRAVNRLNDEKTLRIGGNMRVPTKVKDARPVYPPDAMDAKIQGVVIMDIRIDEQGRVTEAHVLRSIPALDQAAIDAVKQWEFTPTLMNGVPTAVIVTVTVQFTLK